MNETTTTPQPKYVVGQNVTWDRGVISNGHGVVTEVKTLGGANYYMVRDARNALFLYTEEDLTPDG